MTCTAELRSDSDVLTITLTFGMADLWNSGPVPLRWGQRAERAEFPISQCIVVWCCITVVMPRVRHSWSLLLCISAQYWRFSRDAAAQEAGTRCRDAQTVVGWSIQTVVDGSTATARRRCSCDRPSSVVIDASLVYCRRELAVSECVRLWVQSRQAQARPLCGTAAGSLLCRA